MESSFIFPPNSIDSPTGISRMLIFTPMGLGLIEAVKDLRVNLFRGMDSGAGAGWFDKDLICWMGLRAGWCGSGSQRDFVRCRRVEPRSWDLRIAVPWGVAFRQLCLANSLTRSWEAFRGRTGCRRPVNRMQVTGGMHVVFRLSKPPVSRADTSTPVPHPCRRVLIGWR